MYISNEIFEEHEFDEIDNKKEIKENKKENKPDPFFNELKSFVKSLLFAAIIAIFTNTFILTNAIIPSGSMENTIMTGDRIFGFRLAYTFSNPKYGDVIIFNPPDEPQKNYIKRIIGLPGDTIEIKDNIVYLNGIKLNENYIKEDMQGNKDSKFVVPEDSYFVMGDNRNYSLDSRFWKTSHYVTRDSISAKAVIRYYPNPKLIK